MDVAAVRIVFCLLGTVVNGMSEMQNANIYNIPNVSSSSNVPPLQREGHDKDIEKVMLPMLLGLKLSGLATATFTILKIFVLQALMASKVALLGALLLAFKSLYVYLRDKYWKTKLPQLETYPYPGLAFPHQWPQWDWPEGYNYHHSLPEDYYIQGSDTNNVVNPYSYPYPYATHHNDSFAVKADQVKLTTSPSTNENKPFIARITETTFD